VKGEWSGQPLILADWQMRDIVRPMFGTLRDDGLRRYRQVYVEVPRRNMKSTLAAAVALWLLLFDGEPGADVVSAAADKQQADVVFSIARAMVEQAPALAALIHVYRRELVVPSTQSTYRVISSESYSKHGLSLSGVIVDELHAHESRDLLDVLLTSMGSRRQPLAFIISTAGVGRDSVAWQFHEHAEQVRAGALDAPEFLGVLYGASESDDWTSPDVWRRANPGYGVSIKADYLAAECRRAQHMPAYENAFKRLHLNLWTSSDTKWLDMTAWDACGDPVDVEALRGRRCFVGVDLSSTKDMSAAALVFPDADGGYTVLVDAWLPERSYRDRVQRHGMFDEWARRGYLTLTPGDIIDHDAIEARVREYGERYEVAGIGFDPWAAARILPRLAADGLPAVAVPQNMSRLSPPTKALEAAVLSGKLRHGGHPVLRWAVANVTLDMDSNENIRPSKARSAERIDPVVALVIGLSQALVDVEPASIYDVRPPLVVTF
jgi:phage terminase large subunit-like protein